MLRIAWVAAAVALAAGALWLAVAYYPEWSSRSPTPTGETEDAPEPVPTVPPVPVPTRTVVEDTPAAGAPPQDVSVPEAAPADVQNPPPLVMPPPEPPPTRLW